MIKLQELCRLNDPFVSAGSGLVIHQDHFYIVADDELGLFSLKHDFSEKGRIHRVFPGDLPEDYKERKRLKPDIEALIVVQDKLLLIPSGSKPNRNKGALVSIGDFKSQIVSFSRVYSVLQGEFRELNIEGAVLLENNIRLFQRGNGKLRENAIIDLSLEHILKDEVSNLAIQRIELGEVNKTPLTFTDATLMKDMIYFLAAGEKTESTYDDGEFAGAVIGMMDATGNILKTVKLDIDAKPEGLSILGEKFYLVTDDDNRENPSRIFSGPLRSLIVD